MKKIALLLTTILLIAGISGIYGYSSIYSKDDETNSLVAETEDQTQENNSTVEEEPEDPPVEDKDTFFRGIKDECFEHGGMERCWKLYVPNRQMKHNQSL